jgi:prepilin-type N-terminal cleavage/methylation domain-containing protein
MAAHKNRGFTLLELLVGLTIAALVVTLAFQAMLSHGRYARTQSERARLQQHGRGALEMIAAELRGADPAGLVEASGASVSFMSVRAWGVTCRHTETRLSVLFTGAAVGALDPGDEWLALPPVGSAVSWQFLPVADLTSSSAEREAAAAACAVLGSTITPQAGPASGARMYAPRVAQGTGGTLGIAPGENGLEPGTTVNAFDRARYDSATSSVGPGLWIRRNSGPAMQMQPLAGPVRPDGLRFTYYSEDGSVLSVPIGAAERRGVHKVRVFIAPQSRSGAGGALQQDSASVLVVLRNAL